MTLSEQIDEFLIKIQNGRLVFLVEESPAIECQAIDKALEYELIKKEGDFYRLRQQGNKAIKAGGFDKWEQENERRENERSNITSINVSGHAIIGNNNSGNTQGSSFRDLNNLSPTTKNTSQENQSVHSSKTKTDHSIWDKIKYISVVVGGICAAIAAIGKLLNWF